MDARRPLVQGEAMIPLGRATQLNPPTPLLHPPTHPRSHITWRALVQDQQQLSISTRGNYTPAETEGEAYRGAHTTRRRPCDQPAAARRCYYPQRVDCWNFFFPLLMIRTVNKKKAAVCFFQTFSFSFLFFSCILYWVANTPLSACESLRGL